MEIIFLLKALIQQIFLTLQPWFIFLPYVCSLPLLSSPSASSSSVWLISQPSVFDPDSFYTCSPSDVIHTNIFKCHVYKWLSNLWFSSESASTYNSMCPKLLLPPIGTINTSVVLSTFSNLSFSNLYSLKHTKDSFIVENYVGYLIYLKPFIKTITAYMSSS